jgi:hypothetical protein
MTPSTARVALSSRLLLVLTAHSLRTFHSQCADLRDRRIRLAARITGCGWLRRISDRLGAVFSGHESAT